MAEPATPAYSPFNRLAWRGLLGLAIARATMLEILREPFDVTPGSKAPPLAAGPATTLALNTLIVALAFLALISSRRNGRGGGGRLSLPILAAVGLGLWAVQSVVWAGDKYSALVHGSTLLATGMACAAAAWLSDSASRRRQVAAAVVGIAVMWAGYAAYYLKVERPQDVEDYRRNRAAMMAERGWTEGSFSLRQLELKINGTDVSAFVQSPNSYASMMMFGAAVALGLGIASLARGGRPTMTAAATSVVLAGACAGMMAWAAPSKAALACLGLALPCTILGLTRKGSLLGLLPFLPLAAMAGLLIYGLATGGLPGSSLNFRWRYWVGSAGVVHDAPWLGVGYANFGEMYLRHRLPQATEEVRDPHNFLVRAVTELGPLGLGLAVVAAVGGMWRATRPSADAPGRAADAPASDGVKDLAWIAAAALALSIAAGVDLTSDRNFVLLEVIKRILLAGCWVMGAVAVWSATAGPSSDAAVRRALAVGLAMLLLHNLVDFSLFEPAIGLAAALALGSITAGTVDTTGQRRGWGLATAGTALLTVAMAGATAWVTAGEWIAREADEYLRANRVSAAGQRMAQAAALVPINSDYFARAARAFVIGRQALPNIRELLDQASAADPTASLNVINRGRLELIAGPGAQIDLGLDCLRRGVLMNPNALELRVEFAGALDNFDHTVEAEVQYRKALDIDAAMDFEEPRRLTAAQRDKIQDRLAQAARGPQPPTSRP